MIVIGFCGLPGSGKSTALEAVRDLGVTITMGDVIRNEAKTLDLIPNDTNLGKIAKELRVLRGNDFIAEKTIELIKNQDSDIIFVDGVRSLEELNLFRKNWKFHQRGTLWACDSGSLGDDLPDGRPSSPSSLPAL